MQFLLEQLGAAAVVRERRERPHHRKLADVAGAEIAFQAPDADDQLLRHAELPLDAGQQRGVALQELAGAVDAPLRDAGRGVFLEALAEGAALAAVERENVLVDGDAREGLVDHLPRDALRRRLARDRGDEGVEVAAALGCERGGGENERDENGSKPCEHSGLRIPRGDHGTAARNRSTQGGANGVKPAFRLLRASKCRFGRRIAHRHCRNKGARSPRPKRQLKAAGPSANL